MKIFSLQAQLSTVQLSLHPKPPLRQQLQQMVLQAPKTLLLQLLPVLRQEREERHRAPGDAGVEEDQDGGGGGRVRYQQLVQGYDRGLKAPTYSLGNF